MSSSTDESASTGAASPTHEDTLARLEALEAHVHDLEGRIDAIAFRLKVSSMTPRVPLPPDASDVPPVDTQARAPPQSDVPLPASRPETPTAESPPSQPAPVRPAHAAPPRTRATPAEDAAAVEDVGTPLVPPPRRDPQAPAPIFRAGGPSLPATPEPQRQWEPDAYGRVGAAASRLATWFVDSITLARVGLVLLMIGLGFLIQYAAVRGFLPIELRLAASAVLGMLLAVAGWRMRQRRRLYALTLQGGGLAIVYLTTFAALQLYALLPMPLAFALLTILAAVLTVLAALQDALSLAIIGLAGGLSAPLLTGSGENLVVLYAYDLFLNLGVVGIALWKAWRPLILLGFYGTMFSAGLWGTIHYRPALFGAVEGLLVAFFVLYLVVTVAYALRRTKTGFVDDSLVFTLPLAALGLQASLVAGKDFGMAWSSVAMAVLYLGSGWGLYRYARQRILHLVEIHAALGLGFASLALPFALDAAWTAAGWAALATVAVWIGARQQRRWLRIVGIALLVLASGALLFDIGSGELLFGWSDTAAEAFVAAATLGVALLLNRAAHVYTFERTASTAFLLVALAWWSFAGGTASRTLAVRTPDALYLPFLALSAMLGVVAGRRLAWRELRTVASYLLYLAVGVVLATVLLGRFTLEGGWPSASSDAFVAVAALSTAWLLRRVPVASAAETTTARALVTIAFGWWSLAAYAAAYELSAPMASFLVLLAISANLAVLVGRRLRWPDLRYVGSNLLFVGTGVAALEFNTFVMGGGWGAAATEYGVAIATLAAGWWLRTTPDADPRERATSELLAPLALVWWCVAGVTALAALDTQVLLALCMVFFAATAVATSFAGRGLHWPGLRNLAWILVVLTPVALLSTLPEPHPFAALGWLGLPLVIATALWTLQPKRCDLPDPTRAVGHALLLWTTTALAVLELTWALAGWVAGADTWRWIGFGLALSGTMLWICAPRVRALPWLRDQRDAYLGVGLGPLVAGLIYWIALSHLSADGDAAPLVYLPLLNPLDVSIGFATLALAAWIWTLRRERQLAFGGTSMVAWSIVGYGFVWSNAMLLRAVHHYVAVPFEASALFASSFVQTSLAIFWTVLALTAMVVSTRLRQRAFWIAGAGLLGVVIVKLMLVDLAQVGTIARIVSFVVVGLLLLLIAYLSPVPPPIDATGDAATDDGDAGESGSKRRRRVAP